MNGEQCNFIHTQQSYSSPENKRNTETCTFYNSKGGCDKGSECRFAHEEKSETMHSSQARNKNFDSSSNRSFLDGKENRHNPPNSYNKENNIGKLIQEEIQKQLVSAMRQNIQPSEMYAAQNQNPSTMNQRINGIEMMKQQTQPETQNFQEQFQMESQMKQFPQKYHSPLFREQLLQKQQQHRQQQQPQQQQQQQQLQQQFVEVEYYNTTAAGTVNRLIVGLRWFGSFF